MRKKENYEMHVVYETDNIEQAQHLESNYKNITVTYHNSDKEISPILTSIINGKKYIKYNPEYIKYLKKKFPGISDEEIKRIIEEKISEKKSIKSKCYTKTFKKNHQVD